MIGTAPVDPKGQLLQNADFSEKGSDWTGNGNVVYLPNQVSGGGVVARLTSLGGAAASLSQAASLPGQAGFVELYYDEGFIGNPNLQITLTTSSASSPTGEAQSVDAPGASGGHVFIPIAATDQKATVEFQVGASPAGAAVELTHISLTFTNDPNGL